MADLVMKRLSLIPVCMLVLLVFLPSFTSVSGITPPTEYRGTSPTIIRAHLWNLPVGAGFVDVGDVIQWHWNSSGNLTFRVSCTFPPDLHTVQIQGLQMDDGIVVNQTGWYQLDWYNHGPGNATIDYLVDVYTPVVGASSIVDESYLNSRTLEVQGVTEGFATGVLVGTDALHLQKADMNGRNWEETVSLVEGRNTITIQSYYWLRPLGAKNFTLTKTVNVIVDTVPPAVSIVSPSNGTSIRGRAVQIYWNCSDSVGLMKVDLRVDNGSWVTVSWGDTLGLGYTPIGLPTGKHVLEVRGTDRAGNQVMASRTVRTDSNDWSLGGPMYGLPSIGIILAAIVLSLVTYFAYARPRPDAQPPPAPVEPAADSKDEE
jgi:hypothetical protein